VCACSELARKNRERKEYLKSFSYTVSVIPVRDHQRIIMFVTYNVPLSVPTLHRHSWSTPARSLSQPPHIPPIDRDARSESTITMRTHKFSMSASLRERTENTRLTSLKINGLSLLLTFNKLMCLQRGHQKRISDSQQLSNPAYAKIPRAGTSTSRAES
jgi:hypothetical protein